MNIQLSESFNWKLWVTRWERMQKQYLVQRNKRFDIILQLLQKTQPNLTIVLDLGCGTGCLTLRLLDTFPDIHVIGIDADPTLLALAQLRTARFGTRVQFLQRDFRVPTWLNGLPDCVDAAVSATALHWLNGEQLTTVYGQIAKILRPGGIFVNADHVGSESPLLQTFWEQRREEIRKQRRDPRADTWDTFINAYLEALGNGAQQIRQQALDKWDGIEDGLPLAWHFDQLRTSGFEHVDCFWRCDCDAIYGGFAGRNNPSHSR